MTDEARVSRVIFEYAGRIGSASGTNATLELNAAMARDLVGADRCSIWLIDFVTNQLWTTVSHGVSELHIPLGEGVLGACIVEKRAIVANDTSEELARTTEPDSAGRWGVPDRLEGRVGPVRASSDAKFSGQIDRKTGYVTRSFWHCP